MAQVELLLPKMGESVAEATVTNWLKEEGDVVELDESVLEIATDKVDSEVPSTHEGVLVKKLYAEGDVVPVGAPFAIIETEGEASASAPAAASAPAPAATPAPTSSPATNAPSAPAAAIVSGDRFYSPLVKNIAKEEGIDQAELDQIPGSGRDGRLTKDDLLGYIKNGRTAKPAAAAVSAPAAATVAAPAPAAKAAPASDEPLKVNFGGEYEIIQMDRMRKLIADHMVASVATSPHVTSYVEVDMTNVVLWRNKIKNEYQKREGEKITFTPIILEAIAKAIKDFPMINVSVVGDKIIKKKNINIGMATALPSGNLIVPVIKDADRMNLIGVTSSVNSLANKARNNKLAPDDIQDGTFTFTNVGSFGNVMGAPIINQPQVAILSAGIIEKKPAVIETPTGDTIGIRHKMFISLSYDHRVVDGALGGSFLRRVGDYLEQFEMDRAIW